MVMHTAHAVPYASNGGVPAEQMIPPYGGWRFLGTEFDRRRSITKSEGNNE